MDIAPAGRIIMCFMSSRSDHGRGIAVFMWVCIVVVIRKAASTLWSGVIESYYNISILRNTNVRAYQI
jgi:hypothetical protein